MNCADLMVSGSFHLCLRCILGSRLHVCVLLGDISGCSRPGPLAALVDLRRREPQPGLGDVSGRSRPGAPATLVDLLLELGVGRADRYFEIGVPGYQRVQCSPMITASDNASKASKSRS